MSRHGKPIRGGVTLGRKEGERIVVGEGEGQIVIELRHLGQRSAQICVVAPREVRVLRAELLATARNTRRIKVP